MSVLEVAVNEHPMSSSNIHLSNPTQSAHPATATPATATSATATSARRPAAIEVRGARVHNLRNIDVDVPLGKIVGIAGVSGSGKSSLALGVLYAEGSRRYLESLSTYTRRRMTQAERADVDDVRYVPAALALHQRPGVPGIRSTFGTMSELLNSLRLMFSRLASHRCPNGHYVEPTLAVAAMQPIVCPECGAQVEAPGAEDLAFNSRGACPTCQGTGIAHIVDESTLVPDQSKTIDEGAVVVWGSLIWSLMTDVCREMGVRTDVPFRDLTDREKEIVYHGPMVKKHIHYVSKNAQQDGELDFTYYSAVNTVKNALSKVKDERGMKRVAKYIKDGVCPDCHGTRLSDAARAPRLRGIGLDEATAMTLDNAIEWVKGVPDSLPAKMRPMAKNICDSFLDTARRLMDLGLGYLSLDRAGSTLSTGERQRVQLARAVRNRTTGVLYVLDEPSIGLHPYNLQGLVGVMDDLVADGNSVVLVDHDTQVLGHADWIVEMGPDAGADGGRVIAQGTVRDLAGDARSVIGPFLARQVEAEDREPAADGGNAAAVGNAAGIGAAAAERAAERVRPVVPEGKVFDMGTIAMHTRAIHTVHPLDVRVPKGRLTVVTGVSGSGKTTMVLESLVPALQAAADSAGSTDSADSVDVALPAHVQSLSAPGIKHAKLIDATPIGINVRSTVATYAGIHDELRKAFARTDDAKRLGFKAGDFSYNTGRLRCPTCDGTGQISLDVQFLPDVQVDCPDCHGSRYGKQADAIRRPFGGAVEYSLPQLMRMSVDEALEAFDSGRGLKLLRQRLQTLHGLGLGYLTIGEQTPGLSGGEAQRLKLASEMGRAQDDSLFVFDEPTIGLHPKDVLTLLDVFQTLIDHGATVIVIEHDLDVMRNADWIIDMGPLGGVQGGRIVAQGTPDDIRRDPDSLTGRFL